LSHLHRGLNIQRNLGKGRKCGEVLGPGTRDRPRKSPHRVSTRKEKTGKEKTN